VFIAGGPLFRECGVDTPARAVETPFDYRPSVRMEPRPQAGVTCYEAEIRFVVGLDGRPEPETIQLIRANNPALGQSLVRSVATWRYSPARLQGMPVRQIVTERRGVGVRVTVSRDGTPPSRPALAPRCG
jgi:hypothetical protein